MSVRRQVRTDEDHRQANLAYAEAICLWAEALVDYRTAQLYSDDVDQVSSLWRQAAVAWERLSELRGSAASQGVKLAFEGLVRRFDLGPDEAKALMLALVPFLDGSFRRRIARYRDNVLLDFANVEFILSMLFDERLKRLDARSMFAPDAPLVRFNLVTLQRHRESSSDSLLSQEVVVPDTVLSFVLGEEQIGREIQHLCRLERCHVAPDDMVMDPKVKDEVLNLVKAQMAGADGAQQKGLVLGICGGPGTGKGLLARVIASELGEPLLTVDSAKLALETDAELVDSVFFAARLWGAALALDNAESLFAQTSSRTSAIYAKMDSHPGVVLVIARDKRALDTSLDRYIVYQVDLAPPNSEQREAIWQKELTRVGMRSSRNVDIQALASSFQFTGGQIANAITVARDLARAGRRHRLTHADLEAGAWAQVRADMEEYSKRRRIRLTLDDLVLPEEGKRQVAEVIDAARYRTFIMTKWGFGKRLSTGKGLVCLFVGEPGTGKTLAAEILAETLGQDLYQISIPRVMSKYVGETEKNIERIFATARANNSILLFDEADALFTSRVKVQTSVDRFSNMEINLLLQEIERFDGIVILTTNLEKNLDRAFERRIQFKIRFPFPDKKHRTLIWQKLIPEECPVSPDVDWDFVGESFELSGGHIKNAILRAAYKAARERSPITIDHIVAAAEAECRAAGRLFRGLRDEEF